MKIILMIFSSFLIGYGTLFAGIIGDIDRDGKIGLTEATYALQTVAGKKSKNPTLFGIIWKDTWNTGQVYRQYDAVHYDGSSYLCVKEHLSGSSEELSDLSTWNVLALKGGVEVTHSLSTADGSLENALFVDNYGKIGIGTTNPTANLHIYGRDAYILVKSDDNNTHGNAVYRADAKLKTDAARYQVFIDGQPKWGMGNDRTQNVDFTIIEYSNDIAIQNERLLIQRGTGNIGIGTTNPTQKLHVNGSIRTKSINVTQLIKLEPTSTPPDEPSEGDMYMDSDDHILKVYNGTEWKACW